MQLQVNGQLHDVPAHWREDRLLFVLRDAIGLAGPKFGCGLGQCGACTVLLDGAPTRACTQPVAAVGVRAVTTVEGLAARDGALHPVQRAWLALSVAQCGHCQGGMMMAAAALLHTTAQPSDAQIDAALAGHLCRCGTHARVRQAIHQAAAR